MNPGELRHRIEIEKSVLVDNPNNEQEKQWTFFKKIWAKIDCVGNGRKQIQAGKESTSLNYEITIRFTKDIDNSMRIKYGSKIFNIDHVVNYKELNRELHLFCTFQEEGVYKNE
jgi:SPP1 family predicted phage head-tail adaptor